MVQDSFSLFVRDIPSAELAEALAKPASFKLQYFPLLVAGQTARDILTFGGAKWENDTVAPKDWGAIKPDTPFGCMPILHVKGQNGRELHLSESAVVDTYLAKLYGLMGDNEYEAALITGFYSSSAAFQNGFAATISWSRPEAQAKSLVFFNEKTFPQWIANHKKHLEANGSNGHYVGSKLSLADIRTANTIEHMSHQPWGEEFLARVKEVPALYKVLETVNSHPKLAAWRAGEEYAVLSKTTSGFFETTRAPVQASL